MHQPAFRKTVPLKEVAQTAPEFSLVLGGPLYQLYLRTRLAKPPIDLVRRRVIALSLICWLPPLLLSLFAGTAFDRVKVPFLFEALNKNLKNWSINGGLRGGDFSVRSAG